MDILTNDKDVLLEIAIDKTMPAEIYVDKLRLSQILTNLVSNALKFTQQGRVRVSVSSRSINSGNQNLIEQSKQMRAAYLDFKVEDTGIGMSDTHIKRLFKTYSQADSSTTRKYGGTGLGLAISKKLIELMGGHITVTSELGSGSCFTFDLLIDYDPSKQAKNIDEVLIEKSEEMDNENDSLDELNQLSEKIRRQQLTVLLVDDNQVNLIVAKTLLSKAGIQVDTADDGEDAVKMISDRMFDRTEMYDAVLMDIQMPRMDGYQTTKYIREKLELTDLPIIALSANVMSGDVEKSLKAGMNEHLGKPIELELLLKSLWKSINP